MLCIYLLIVIIIVFIINGFTVIIINIMFRHSLSYIVFEYTVYGYGSIPINTIFSGMNIHLPAIFMFTRGTRFWHTAIYIYMHINKYMGQIGTGKKKNANYHWIWVES